MRRNEGNSFKSLQFTLYFLAIKIGLIAPNVPLELNQNQQNQPLVTNVYNPYVSVLNEYRPSGLYMGKIQRIQRPVPQHSLSYHSQSVMNEIRAGDLSVREAAWLFITIWMLRQQSVGFQPVRQAPPPPHHQLFGGTLNAPRNHYFSKSSQPGASLQMQRPPHQDFTALTKEQRRNLMNNENEK